MSGYRAKKRFGQNFLRSDSIIHDIIAAIAPTADDTVVEIGPGLGALTAPLARAAGRLIAVELDRDLFGQLQSRFGTVESVEIVNADILTYTPEPPRFKLAGNLPFNITTPVLEWMMPLRDHLVTAHLMMQREVARRVSSHPGQKDWSPLAIFVQIEFEVTSLFDIGPEHFTPAPEVTSSLVRFVPRATPLLTIDRSFELVVRRAFVQRRKTLANNLVPTLVPDSRLLADWHDRCGLNSAVRAEQVTIEQFLALTAHLRHHKLLD